MIPYKILVIDDSEQIRDLLKHKLRKWGHSVFEAGNGREGYHILQREEIHFVITDWMMPDMNGIQLCEQVRATITERYVYIILLTARSDLRDLASGMEAGADDFISKPFHLSELQARVNAGIRILELERELKEQQNYLNQVNSKLEETFQRIRKDLKFAARLQHSLLPRPCEAPGKYTFESLFVPCRFLAGDIFNIIEIDERRTLYYILDVAGKGVPAALLSFTLSKVITPMSQGVGQLMAGIPFSNPQEAVAELNRHFKYKGDLHDLQYFTMIYAVIDHQERVINLTQAGHPSPIFMPVDRDPELLGEGGPPVGLWAPGRANYTMMTIPYRKGDRLYLYSDGVTEAFNREGDCYSEERLLNELKRHRDEDLAETLTHVEQDLKNWTRKSEFDDDLTVCAVELG